MSDFWIDLKHQFASGITRSVDAAAVSRGPSSARVLQAAFRIHTKGEPSLELRFDARVIAAL